MIDEKKLIEKRTYYPSPVSDYEAGWNDCNRDWMKRIEEQPQAGYGAGKWMGSVCSCCGESVSEWYNFKFCPMCGTKMEDYEEQGKLVILQKPIGRVTFDQFNDEGGTHDTGTND